MDELIDIVNIKGEPTGDTCFKSFAHQNGILHASVHVWLYNEQGEILIQKRSHLKQIYPNLWDVSVAGHIESLESPLSTACRETYEEIGLKIPKELFDYHGIWEEKHLHNNGLIDHEIHHIYSSILREPIQHLSVQKEEVSAVKLITVNNFKEQCKNKHVFVPHSIEYYNYIINTLSESIKNEK